MKNSVSCRLNCPDCLFLSSRSGVRLICWSVAAPATTSPSSTPLERGSTVSVCSLCTSDSSTAIVCVNNHQAVAANTQIPCGEALAWLASIHKQEVISSRPEGFCVLRVTADEKQSISQKCPQIIRLQIDLSVIWQLGQNPDMLDPNLLWFHCWLILNNILFISDDSNQTGGLS